MRGLAGALAALLAVGCSAAPPWVSPQEHQILSRQLLELERRAAQSELEIERLKHRLGELEGSTTTTPSSAPPVVPPPTADTPLDREPTEPVRRPGAETIEVSDLGDELSAPEAAETTGSDYERGLVALRDGRADEAERTLARFAAENPESDLADNAWFWIGEARLARGETATAIAAYRECLERFPEGNKAPDAMLKLGHAFALAGERAAARETWSELVRRFPATAAAETARGRLATL